MRYRFDEEQRSLVLQWLKAGYMDNTEIYKLEAPPDLSEDELKYQAERFAKANFQDYCIQMKEKGKCKWHDKCRECRMFTKCKELDSPNRGRKCV